MKEKLLLIAIALVIFTIKIYSQYPLCKNTLPPMFLFGYYSDYDIDGNGTKDYLSPYMDSSNVITPLINLGNIFGPTVVGQENNFCTNNQTVIRVNNTQRRNDTNGSITTNSKYFAIPISINSTSPSIFLTYVSFTPTKFSNSSANTVYNYRISIINLTDSPGINTWVTNQLNLNTCTKYGGFLINSGYEMKPGKSYQIRFYMRGGSIADDDDDDGVDDGEIDDDEGTNTNIVRTDNPEFFGYLGVPNVSATNYQLKCNQTSVNTSNILNMITNPINSTYGSIKIFDNSNNDVTSNLTLSENSYKITYYINYNSSPCTSDLIDFSIYKDRLTWLGGNWSSTPNLDSEVKISSDYNTINNGSFSACNLTVDATKTLNIGKDNYVEVKKNIVNNTTSDKFVVQNDANLIQLDDTGTFTGNPITLHRVANMKRLDYVYWGSPVIGQNVKNFSPNTLNSRFYVYDESSDYFDGVFVTSTNPIPKFTLQNPSTYTFEKARGYAIRAANTASITTVPVNRTFIGIPHTGNFTYNITKSPNVIANNNISVEMGNNLISNPYPSNIDLDTFFSINSSIIYGTAYFWTNTNYNPPMQGVNYPSNLGTKTVTNNYAMYNKTGGNPAPFGWSGGTGNNTEIILPTLPNNIIKPGQAFIIKSRVAAPVSGLITSQLAFNNSIRTKNYTNSQFYSRVKQETVTDRYWLALKTPLDFVTPILVAYKDGATNNYDVEYDAEPATIGGDSFYSFSENKKLAIQGRENPFNNNDSFNIGSVNGMAGNYQISLVKKEGIFESGQPIYLFDKVNNTEVNLQQQSYNFTSDLGEFNDRFIITYQPQNILATSENTDKDIIVYKSNNKIIIDAKDTIKQIQIYDISGKLLKNKYFNSKKIEIPDQINTKIILLKIYLDNKIISKKISKNGL